MARTMQSHRLRRVLFAYTVNRLGSWLGLVALSLAVFDHTHSALAVAALLLAWQALPALVVPVLVARVETSQRGGELSGLYLFEGAVTAGLALLVWHFWLPGVLFLAALDGAAALAANALLRAAVARIARDPSAPPDGAPALAPSPAPAPAPAPDFVQEDLDAQEAERRANAALNVAFSISFVAGPLIGGVVSAAAGVPVALLIDVGTFLLCGALLVDLRAHIEAGGDDSVAARMRSAWEHITGSRSLRALLAVDAVALVLVQAGGPIEVAYVKATLHGGDSGYGVFVTAWGAGAVVASIVFARSPNRPLGVILSSAIFALGAAFVGISLAPSLFLACLAAFVAGAGNGLYVPSIISLVQRLTPQELHGRLIGAVESLGALALALGLPLGGALVALSSPRAAFLMLGLGTLAITAAYVRLALTAFASAGGQDARATSAPAQATGATGAARPPAPPD